MNNEKLRRLLVIGFTDAGEWTLNENTLMVTLHGSASTRNVLYAFAVDDALRYIGKTTQPLSTRMAGYRTPGPSQATNKKNHTYIRAALEQGQRVKIYVLPDNGLLHYGGFHVNLAAGLEDSLIRELKPDWNGGQKETASGTLEPLS
jgi:hypothetical protein